MNLKKKTKNDFVLAGLLLMAALAFFLFQRFIFKEKGESVTITQDGTNIGQYSLQENKTIPLESQNGYNLLVIEDGSARMVEADCPDKLCVKQRRISNAGESLICLPHKLIVTVDGNRQSKEPEVDSVTY